MSVTAKKLVYKKYGHPLEEVALVEETIETTLKPGQALVKVLYSPVNPVDYVTVMGMYPLKPALPAVPGLEGVVEVVKGDKLQKGDHCIINQMSWGAWKQMGVIEESQLTKVPKELPIEAAATLIINPCTSYLMMNYILDLKPGDVIIQNAANSALGQITIQLAKAAGVKTINVIRERPNLKETIDMLKALGADAVITDAELKKGLPTLNLGLPAPRLALECIGGPASLDLAAALADGGTLSTYGGMSGQPINTSQGDLIYRGIHVQGFWLSRWMDQNADKFPSVIQAVMKLYTDGKLKLPKIHKYEMAEWKEAVKAAMGGFSNEKILIQFN